MSKIFKSVLWLLIISPGYMVSAQLCTQNNRFVDVSYFSKSDVTVLKDVTYKKTVDSQGASKELRLDLYFPSKTKDTMTKRPFILFIHGGGFMNGHRGYMTKFCQDFSKMGYVTATMSYRLGFDQSVPGDNIKAVYKAQQDAHAALEFMMQNAKKYHIDPNWVFIGGSSAGAITSFLTAYGSQEEWNAAFAHLEPMLGSLSDKKEGSSFTIKGIFNQVGCVSPIVLNNQKLIPTISFHGDQDQSVPIDQSPLGLGSRALHNLMKEKKVCNDISIVPGGDHAIYQSEEGVSFVVNRTACFFKSIMCDSCTSSWLTKEVKADCVD